MEASEGYFRVSGREIGEGRPPYLVAEMACAHQGSADVAVAMVDIAAEAQVDALQVQLFTADRLLSPKHPNFALMRALTIKSADWKAVFDRAHDRRLPIYANVFSVEDLEFAVSLGAVAIKLHSTDLSNSEMLSHAARTGLPTTLSVGASTLSEIESAIESMSASGSPPVLLMHGFQAFPTPIELSRLRFIPALKDRFGLPVGFQDHTDRNDPFAFILPLMAIGAGAALIEKHFTYGEDRTDIDHESSLAPAALGRFVKLFREASAALGSSNHEELSASELKYRKKMKKCLVAARNLRKGDRLRAEDVALLRAAEPRLSPQEMLKWIGKPLVADVDAGEAIAPEHFAEEVS